MYGSGEEPDPRFSLANERTFLAWIRTALAFVLAGLVLDAVGGAVPSAIRGVAVMLLLCIGLVGAMRAWVGWMLAEAAMRRGQPMPGFLSGAILAIGAAAAIGLIAIGLASA